MSQHLLLEPCVRAALLEDLGRSGDITSTALIPLAQQAMAVISARQAGVIAGSAAAQLAFRLLDPTIAISVEHHDGDTVTPGSILLKLTGNARALLAAERTALNFLGHLSGIATLTSEFVQQVRHTKTAIVCTRKTTPGMRFLEKEAVRLGGGKNHRFGLDDAMLIKDNHVFAAGGISAAITRARAAAGHLVAIELEVDTLAQLQEALDLGVERILLDNMSLDELREAVALTAGRAILEASGSMHLDRVRAVAETGVDLISVGAITHSAPNFDLGLDFC